MPDDSRFRRPTPNSDTRPKRPRELDYALIDYNTPEPPPPTITIDDTQPITAIKPRRRSRLRIRALLILLILANGLLVVALRREPAPEPTQALMAVTLEIDNDHFPVTTFAENVAAFLTENNVTLGEADRISPGLTAPIEHGMVIQITRAREVTLVIDEQISEIRTNATLPLDILRAAGIELETGDHITVDGIPATESDLAAWSEAASEIRIQRAFPVYIRDGLDNEDVVEVRTVGGTVGDVLFDADIRVYLADTVEPPVDTTVTPAMQVSIDRSRSLTIFVDGSRLETRTNGQTVADALVEARVTLNGLDYSIPSEHIATLPGMNIRVIRVTEELIEEQEVIPHQTVYQADANRQLDDVAVIQQGADGVINRTIRVRYENGIEISREVENEIQAAQPANQIIAYGTNVTLRSVDTPNGPVQYWRRLRLYATSYHPAALGGDNITSTGQTLTVGIVAIDPDIIPYGTQMYVPGYGNGTAADTGGPRTTPYWIDLGYDDANFVNWHQWVDVYLLPPIPDDIDYMLPVTQRGGPVP